MFTAESPVFKGTSGIIILSETLSKNREHLMDKTAKSPAAGKVVANTVTPKACHAARTKLLGLFNSEPLEWRT
jgi:hypothetical protein